MQQERKQRCLARRRASSGHTNALNKEAMQASVDQKTSARLQCLQPYAADGEIVVSRHFPCFNVFWCARGRSSKLTKVHRSFGTCELNIHTREHFKGIRKEER